MKNILVVEDDDDIRFVLESILTEEGYAVKAVDTVAEAASWMENRAADLVLLDFMLAEGNSAGFVRDLQSRGSEVPVLMMSAAGPQLRGDVTEQVSGFLRKPIVVDDMLSQIERLFSAG